MKKTVLFLIILMMLALTACGGGAVDGTAVNEAATGVLAGEGDGGTAVTVLTADYKDALSVVGQLAIGTVQLDETELAVDETLAAELLPLWQAYQTLGQSDTAAEAELQAVVNQIERTMTPAQIAAIAQLKLTNEGVTTMMQNGELGIGPGGPGGFAPMDDSGDRAGGGGVTGGGGFAGGFPGGGPGGGIPGGGVPGGGLPGGGFPGGGAELSEEDIATRQAEFAQNGGGGFQERMFTGVVVRLLEDKLDIVSEMEVRRNVMDAALTAVAEAANLTIEELQAQLAEGQTMAAVVEASGGDVAALQKKLVEIFSDLPNADELDLAQSVDEWLGIGQGVTRCQTADFFEELAVSKPDFGNRMVREFQEYRPYVSILQFRREIGKYVDETRVAFYEQYVYVPVNVDEADAATLRQIPGVDATIAEALIAARPYGSHEAFLAKLGEYLTAEQEAVAAGYLEMP